jgi:putative ABC transport system permease protein
MIGKVDILLLAVAVLVVVVAGVSILVSIYNSMADRKRPIAIMRALGARRSTIFSIIVLEAVTLCLAGGVLGATIGHGIVWIAANALHSSAGIVINPLVPGRAEPFVFLGLLVLGVLVGTIPAMKAYRTDIGEGLNPTA